LWRSNAARMVRPETAPLKPTSFILSKIYQMASPPLLSARMGYGATITRFQPFLLRTALLSHPPICSGPCASLLRKRHAAQGIKRQAETIYRSVVIQKVTTGGPFGPFTYLVQRLWKAKRMRLFYLLLTEFHGPVLGPATLTCSLVLPETVDKLHTSTSL
jgi:hypothetical protein